MEKKNIDLGLKRFREINKYTEKLIIEQEAPLDPKAVPPADPAAGTPPPADPTAAAPVDTNAQPPEGATEIPAADETTPEGTEGIKDATDTENAEVAADTAADDTTEELDITDLVNMTKSIKKQLDDTQGQDTGATQKMDDVFSKLGELETKLGEMDQVIAKIDQLGSDIRDMKPKTPVEKLEMRSLDSYPFSKNPTEFFNEKQKEMKASGKNEYVLTKGDVENYGKYDIMKSFNPKAEENDYNF
jgi:hypothetical protein